MIEWEELRLSDFLSWKDLKLSLVPKNPTLILGDNRDNAGASSNGCLSGDTLIDCPRDLNKFPRGIPIKDLVGKEFWTYSWNNGRPILARASNVHMSGAKRVFKVLVSPGTGGKSSGKIRAGKYLPPCELVGTGDHLVLMSDGKWKPLGKLLKGDSIMSMYRIEHGGWRSLLKWTGSVGRISEQQYICECLYGPRPTGAHAHHKDDDDHNNSPDNLEWLDSKKHCSLHLSKRNRAGTAGWLVTGIHPRGMLGKKHTDETKAKIYPSAETLRKAGEATAKKLKTDPEFSARMREVYAKNGKKLGEFQKRRFKTNHMVSASPVEIGLRETYDMTVEGAENFVANGMFVHNSGKSSIFDGLVWTLFGSTMRGLSGDDVIRHGEERALGHVSWKDERGSYSAERTRHSGATDLRLWVNGKEADGLTPTITQKRLEEALGFEADTFVAACIFGQDVTRWASYNDKDQKLILERLIGLSQWDRILKEVRNGRQAQGISKQLAEASLASATSDLSDLQDRQTELDAEEAAWAKTIASRSLEIEEALGKAEGALQDLSVEIGVKRSQVDALKVESAGAAEALKAFRKGQIEAVQARAKADRLEEKLKDCDESQADLDLHSEGDPCPTCERPFDEASVLAANKVHAGKITSLELERKDLLAELEIMKAVLAQEPAEEPESESLETLQTQMEILSVLQDGLHKQETLKAKLLSEVEHLGSKADAFEASRLEIQKTFEKAKSKVAQMTKDVDEAQKNKESYDWLEKAFGPQGIRNFLLESVLPRFEGWANDVLRELGPNLRLELRSQTALKSGEMREKLNCSVFLDGRVALYESLSAGERQRVDVSIALALEYLSAERNPVGLAVFDEIFERMDPEGCDRVARLLKKRFAKQGCWIITHNDALRNLFGRTLTVRKEGGVSAVSQ